ncbi:UNVERIFIED_CONTAM: hypothetical protein PYX00_006646 [Menopon gallinae]|uniref:RING-type E3 ubiquitin transferase n=1 Tax=Menopon gallinae TaxID=328185 RepID=A0AAW2HW42_9NEOP
MSLTSQEQVGLNKTWELSLYELQRTPQEAITDQTEIAVSPRSLHSELMCPICLDMLKKTMTTKECLHRFCSDCIITALRSGNKECPTCRKKLVSKRSLRPDPNFDLLISKIYPSRDEYEAHQERVMAKISKSHSQAALVSSITEGIKLQSQNRPNRKTKIGSEGESVDNMNVSQSSGQTPVTNSTVNSNSVAPTSTTTSVPMDSQPAGQNQSMGGQASSAPSSSRTRPPSISDDSPGSPDSAGSSESLAADQIELVFMPHPTEMLADPLMRRLKDSVRYIKTPDHATIDHLSKYLAMRLTLDNMDSDLPDSLGLVNFCIYIAPTPGQLVLLTGNQTLRQVNDKYWKADKPLEMYYSINKKT